MTTPMTMYLGDCSQQLRRLIVERAMGYGKPIQLASGMYSNFYFNLRRVLLHPQGVVATGRLMANELQHIRCQYIGGMAEAAIPLVTSTVFALVAKGHTHSGFWLRKTAKGHGEKAKFEGLADDESLEGKPVAVVEDIFTTGGSAMKVVDAVREAGGDVRYVLAIVDREEGADDTFSKAGLRYGSLFKARDLLPRDFNAITQAEKFE